MFEHRHQRRHRSDPRDAWTPIEYTDDGEAEVAECDYTTGTGNKTVTRRLTERRTRLTDKQQSKLWPDWRHFGFLTDLNGTAVELTLGVRPAKAPEAADRRQRREPPGPTR